MSSQPPRLPRSIQFLPWDTAFFGFPIARYRGGHRPSRTNFTRDVLACDRAGIRCLYLEPDVNDASLIAIAQEHRFRLVDVRVNLTLDLSGKLPAPNSVRVRPAAEADLPDLRQIARQNFRESRFYADRHFTRQQCQSLYAAWVDRAFDRSFASHLFVAVAGRRPIGFLALKTDRLSARISLIAVDRHAKGKGAGRSLVAAAAKTARRAGATELVVRTQGRNPGAIRFYERLSFRLEELKLFFHRWNPDD